MIFEVIYKGQVKMHTPDKSCIPPKNILKQMQEKGYEFKKDGKPYVVNERS